MEQLRIPPHSIEAEQSIIGAILIANGTTQRIREAFDLLRPEMFYQHSHQSIFVAMMEMKLSEIDLTTLTDKLQVKSLLDEVGGWSYIGSLAKNTPSSANILAYVDVVRGKFQSREVIGIATSAIEHVYDGEDNQSVVEAMLRNLATIDMSGTYEPLHISNEVEAVMQRIDDRLQGKVSALGIKTGIKGLDDQIGGIKPTWLVVIAGRPSMGKTIMKQFIASNVAQEAPIKNFSMEMDDDETIDRYAAIGSGICAKSMTTGVMSDLEWARLHITLDLWRNGKVDILIDSTPALALNQIKARVKATLKKYPNLAMITIDYLGLMTLPKGERHDLRIGEVTRGLKELAKEIRVPVILLVQANRATDGKRPGMGNLAGSAAIEADADLIFFVHREDVEKEHTPFKGVTELIPAKLRHGDFNKTVYLKNKPDEYGGVMYTMSDAEVGMLKNQEESSGSYTKKFKKW